MATSLAESPLVISPATNDKDLGRLTEVAPLPIVLRGDVMTGMSDDEFYRFCGQNNELRFERNVNGEIEVMPPTGSETGHRNIELATQVHIWAKQDNTGRAYDSSTGFRLPDGATRSPDTSWVLRSRLASITAEERKKFLRLMPDFAVELRSESDTLTGLQDKMVEYIANGVRLGLLIDPDNRTVYVYRPDREVETLVDPETVSCEPELLGLVLNLREIFEPT